MNSRLIVEIAWTHLVTKPKQTIVAMLGVTFGISMYILMISFMTGVNQFTENLAMDGSPDVRIYNPVEVKEESILHRLFPNDSAYLNIVYHQRPDNDLPKIRDVVNLTKELEKWPEIEGVAPQVLTQSFFNNGPIQISGTVSGIDIDKQVEHFNLAPKIVDGRLEDLLTTRNAIVLGYGLAKKVNAGVGDRVSVSTPEGNLLMLRVVGIFQYGMAQFDETRAYATIATVQKMMQRDPSYITDLHIKLKDFRRAKELSARIRDEFGIFTEDWETANASLLAGDRIRYVMTGVVSFTLLMVAGFGIYNIMNMNIINKLKDIAIFKAMGFQGRDITGIFLVQSSLIGIAGGFLGLLIGYLLCLLVAQAPFPEAGFVRIETMPVAFEWRFYAFGLLFGFVTTFLAGWFPSRKASRVDPVAIIRG